MGFGGVGDNREVYKELDNHEKDLSEAKELMQQQSRSYKRTRSVLEQLYTCLQQFLYKTSIQHHSLQLDKEGREKEQQLMDAISQMNLDDSGTLKEGYETILARVEKVT